MFEGEAKLLALLPGKGLVQGLHEGLGIGLLLRLVLLVLLAEKGPAARKGKAGGGGGHEFATGKRAEGWFLHSVCLVEVQARSSGMTLGCSTPVSRWSRP